MPKPYKVRDPFFKRAKEEGYKARSAYKLKEIQSRFRVISRGDRVIDLGAAPGSFLQVILEIVGKDGFVVGLDLQSIDLRRENLETYVCDIYDDEKVDKLLSGGSFDVLTSDLAPKTTGIKDADAYHSVELNFQALEIGMRHLKVGGNMVLKVFQGEDFDKLYVKVKRSFVRVKSYKPSATRDRSRETYIVALGKK